MLFHAGFFNGCKIMRFGAEKCIFAADYETPSFYFAQAPRVFESVYLRKETSEKEIRRIV
jgi:hypothetical protein